MALQTYRKKRDFSKTPEPRGRAVRRSRGGATFVIQKHAARRMHHDFRLEIDGVLKSWAVPKGPPLERGEQALAVETEDHPIEYGGFEGVIPKGEYGGGTVMLYDRGTWEPEGDPRKGLREGKLTFRLQGERLRGRWSLVRMADRDGGGKKKEWLLIKRTDPEGGRGRKPRAGPDRSVASGRTMEEIAREADRVWSSREGEIAAEAEPKRGRRRKRADPASPLDPGALEGARRKPLPSSLKPQLATLVRDAPDGDGWLHEIKHDGYRLLAFKRGDGARDVRLLSRSGQDWTERFPTVRDAVARLAVERAILDGEVVVLGSDGVSRFQALQNSLAAHSAAEHVYFCFDLPYCGDFDLTAAPLQARKTLLARLLAIGGSLEPIRYSAHVVGRGPDFHRSACELNLEGVVSKRVDARYEQRRSPAWVKVKCLRRQEFVVGGWTPPEGSRQHFGSLLLGVYDGAELVYAGKVGTGFSQRTLRELSSRLADVEADSPAFADPPKGREARGVRWTRPTLVAEVAFTEWTSDGILRHPVFQGLREDRDPKSVRRELPADGAPAEGARRGKGVLSEMAVTHGVQAGRSAPQGRSRTKAGSPVEIEGVRLTSPERVVYPGAGLTKRDVAEYYVAIADWVLPHVRDRPLTLLRCPQGIEQHCFYQRHVHESTGPPIRDVPVEEDGGKLRRYLAVDDLRGLLSLVQVNALELHAWGARADAIDSPDRIVLDLDPGSGVAWAEVVATAHALRERLDELGLRAFARTTGGKGLHVVVPIERRATWDEAKRFARLLVRELAGRRPDAYVLTATKAKRNRRIYLDYLRNARAASSIASYSTRARPGAPVATPVRWDELKPSLDPRRFTIRSVPRRLKTIKADPWEGFFDVRQTIAGALHEIEAEGR